MEEADLLKERLQIITEKRRIQEDIAKKRREIEEEKLKLQYIKKKAVREQWLMDGLTQQSEQEQEAMRLQAQDEQRQSDMLQSNIIRKEEEIQFLEAQEISICVTEENILKLLKEVERTPDDIIKELSAEKHTDVTHQLQSPSQDLTPFVHQVSAQSPILCTHDVDEEKKATFAIEINVEHDQKTGQKRVISTGSITPDIVQGRGFKVFEDGRKSVYALHPDNAESRFSAVEEMTLREVEDLLHQASENRFPSEVQYHDPVYAIAYAGSSRPSKSNMQNKTQKTTVKSSSCQGNVLCKSASQIQREETQPSKHDVEQQESILCMPGEETKHSYCHNPGQFTTISSIHNYMDRYPGLGQSLSDTMTDKRDGRWSEDVLTPSQGVKSNSPSVLETKNDSDTGLGTTGTQNYQSSLYVGSVASPVLDTTLPSELDGVTLVFMGYENAEDKEEEDVQAELVIIANSDEEDNGAHYMREENTVEDCFHPDGYKSKVFQPSTGIAKVVGSKDILEYWEDAELHKPTFIHKSRKL